MSLISVKVAPVMARLDERNVGLADSELLCNNPLRTDCCFDFGRLSLRELCVRLLFAALIAPLRNHVCRIVHGASGKQVLWVDASRVIARVANVHAGVLKNSGNAGGPAVRVLAANGPVSG